LPPDLSEERAAAEAGELLQRPGRALDLMPLPQVCGRFTAGQKAGLRPTSGRFDPHGVTGHVGSPKSVPRLVGSDPLFSIRCFLSRQLILWCKIERKRIFRRLCGRLMYAQRIYIKQLI
jgi:hypothetical protein